MLSRDGAGAMLDAVLHPAWQSTRMALHVDQEPSAEDWQCTHAPLSGLCSAADSPFLHPPQPSNAFVTLRNDSMAVMMAEKFIRAGEEVGRLAIPFTDQDWDLLPGSGGDA